MPFGRTAPYELGGSRGIGAAIVRRFAAEGGRVGFTYAGSKDAAATLAADTGAKAIRADSADARAVATLVKEHRGLDIRVVNAGVYVGAGPGGSTDQDRMSEQTAR